MSFKIGEVVVHNTHGVGRIVAREARQFTLDKPSEFFIIETMPGVTRCPKKYFIPVPDASKVLRPTVDREAGNVLIHYLKTATLDVDEHQTWNSRYRQYMELIHSGDPMMIAKVYLSLNRLRDDKELSFGERAMLQQAHGMLSAELSLVGLTIPERGAK